MALDKETLELSLQKAFDDESDKKIDPAEARHRQAKAIANAIDIYVKGATVTTPAGVPVSTVGTAMAQTGTTTAPGIGVIS